MKRALWSLAGLVCASFAAAQTDVIVRLADGVSPSVIANRYHIKLLDTTPSAPFAIYQLTDAQYDAVSVALDTDPQVVWSEDDDTVQEPSSDGGRANGEHKGSTLPAVGDRRALQTINTAVLSTISWDRTLAESSGRAVRVAILDTGLSPLQPALWKKVDASLNVLVPTAKAYDWPGKIDSNGDGIYDSKVGHGTMVAGIVDQISPNSRLVIAKVADSDGQATLWSLIKGLAFAVVTRSEVANVSLGTLNHLPAIDDVLDWCSSKSLVVVAAIGNNSKSQACYPAAVRPVICVGGLTYKNAKASFSNYSSVCLVSAPAVGIVSQDYTGRIAVWDGTSFATPMVSATVAEALRHTTPQTSFEKFVKGFDTYGVSLDAANPLFKGKIGKLLNFKSYLQHVLVSKTEP